MKHLCLCSARAFEVFVKEIAGVTLKRPHPPTPTLHVRRTTIGPTSILRHFASSRVTAPDGRSIPLKKGSGDSEAWSASLEDGNPAELGKELQSTSEEHLRDDWHAEVEIVTPEEQTAAVSTTEVAGLDMDDPAAQDASRNAEGLDALIAASGSVPPNNPPGGRAQSRLQRKLRRIEAGTYMGKDKKKDKKRTPKEQALEAQTKSILKFMSATRDDREAKGGEQEEPPKKTRDPKSKAATKGAPNLMDVTKEESTAIGNDVKAKATAAATQDSISETSTGPPKRGREPWQVQKNALREKFGDMGWQPRKRLSPDTLEGVRALHASDPDSYTTPILAEHFKVTPEAIRRILRSKWQPSENEIEDRRNRWENRGERKWEAMAAQGVRPPAKWRAKGIKFPHVEKKKYARRVGDAHVRWDDRSPASVGPSLASRIA